MPILDARAIATALNGYKSGTCWMAPCPAHDDTTPSLAIRDTDDGRVLVKCHAGCKQTEVIRALQSRGQWSTDHSLKPTNQPRQIKKRSKPDDQKRTVAALRIWGEARLAHQSPVEAYLRARA
jgi:putative DNA primase/helicase